MHSLVSFVINSILLGVGLAMDAFSVSMANGLNAPKMHRRHAIFIASVFGVMQGLMPLIGFLLGAAFEKYITPIDHWVALALLGFIGANMIKESLSGQEENCDNSFSVKTMFVMAVATSVDALAVGITFAVLPSVNIWWAVTLIAIITCVLSAVGVYIGHKFGEKYKSKAEFVGGAILILMGIKILLQHLGVINF